ncbi:hypothetical protein PF005_g26302 [Phytophthora fragariae]|uniref:BZIP domain-containing protein n=1 Tax=Phytophthora fragariae TaxID=53985 RepID=A0A6A3DQM6_9STRA|nr:hypothetical protein PF003_g34493 [Phytophthora fragariae]KAE8923245.1 hypothetical protein PF009_g26505 [Phytophthora fragariae]KAE8972047.1 hypothetical protein PF011_g25797 [Phytophthora fragariae]KAE9071684.1 hypothetical protein PF010_g25776 [Phytophthora fragariae]KAE9073499.1 hypothetical protein PF007_g25788 [Phytophthora fragariae]
MDRISSIFARFEPSRDLTSDVIGHVLPRASVGGSGAVFHQLRPGVANPHAKTEHYIPRLPPISKPLPVARPTSPEIASPTSVAVQQNPFDYLMEASLAQKMSNVAVRKSIEPQISREAPVHDLAQASVQASVCSTESAAPIPKPTRSPQHSAKTIQVTDSENPKPKRKRIRLKTARRREQCRTNQARYRKKQTEHAKDLEVAVEQLRREIPMLETQRSRLISNAKSSAWYVVMEYFHIFRNGSRPSDGVVSGPEAWLQNSETQQQRAFLQSAMSDDVVLGERRGVDALLDQWKRCTTSFDDLQFRVEHMTRVSEAFIAATASLRVTISDATLQNVFPHLLAVGGNRFSRTHQAMLRSKLLGQRLLVPCQLRFEWDEKSERIVRLEQTVDLLTPLLPVLGTLADAAFVLEQARVHQDGSIGDF